jgi:hypothetical protein
MHEGKVAPDNQDALRGLWVVLGNRSLFTFIGFPHRIVSNILLLVFKYLLGEAPEYLGSMIQPKRKGRHSLRSEAAVLLEVSGSDTPQLVDGLSLLRCQTFGTNSLHSSVILNPSRPTSLTPEGPSICSSLRRQQRLRIPNAE